MRLRRTGSVAPIAILAFIAVGVGLTTGPATAGEEISCPFEIDVEQVLSEPVEGWTSGADPWPTELVNLSVFDGPTAELAELIYDDEVDEADTTVVYWLLQADNPRGYWIRCRYANTLVTIERQLPAGVTRCELVFETQISYADGRPVVRSMRCG
jgi:hypothetical protein